MTEAIEVFRDLHLRGPRDRRDALRAHLLGSLRAPWSFDEARSDSIRRNAVSADDVVLLRRDGSSDLPAAGLTLWGTAEGYSVPNVVPLEPGELSRRVYNLIVEEFARIYLEPIAAAHGFTVEMTAATQTLEDWISEPSSSALKRFSTLANKSTGASHPLDEQRWFAFILSAHRNRDDLDASRLAEWLSKVEGWDQDSAHALAGEYERALALLDYVDQN